MFVYVNDRMRTMIPLNISYLVAALKNAGYSAHIFDTSFYKELDRISEERKKEEAGIFQAVNYESIGVVLKESTLTEDLLLDIEKEKPNLIVFSVFSQSKCLNFKLAEIIKKAHPQIPIIFGGIHVNIEPEKILSLPFVDYVCVGEGEELIAELADSLFDRKPVDTLLNLGYKKNNEIFINNCRPLSDLDQVPFQDWDGFEQYHQYGPFRGTLYKMGLVEATRTCPYNCTYCGNGIIKKQYRKSGQKISYRHKSPDRLIKELEYYKKRHGTNFINFVDGTFLAQDESVLEELMPKYREKINLPFFCDATVHCVTPRKVELLKEMGCVCLNMGIETGNEEYRKKYLGRFMSNEKIIKAFHMAKDVGLETRSYNIIGLPFQTRKEIMDTIELSRVCGVGSVSLSIFMPYEGTALRETCIQEGLIQPDQDIVGDGTNPIIKNPNLTDDELIGLYNTFAIYVLAPSNLYPLIKIAEDNSDFSVKLRKYLIDIYCNPVK